jgi:hypothetical protein
MTKNKIAIVLMLLVTSVFLSGCSLLDRFLPAQPDQVDNNQIELLEQEDLTDIHATEYEFVATMSGQTALELIQANVEVETQDFGDAGQFITSIGGLAGNEENYWAFYVNDEYAQVGASQTILEEGDKIKFTYEAIKDAF